MFRRPSIRSTVTTLAAAAVLVGGADLASYAATGHPLLIGKANSGVGTTALKNLGRGAALSLNSAKSSPPLVVNSSKLVKHLNANMVGGMTANKLNPSYGLYQLGQPGGTLNLDPHIFTIKPPTGYVHWSLTGVWTSQTGTDSMFCIVFDKRYLNNSSNLAFIYAEFTKALTDPDAPFIQQQGFAHFTKDQRLLIGCEASGTGPIQIAQPITFTFHKIAAHVKHGKPFTVRNSTIHRGVNLP
jgi:hypothetical protein